MKTALILGASGLIGGHVLQLLLEDERYEKVICMLRKPLGISHPKLQEQCGDLFALENFKADFEAASDLFVAIGTTRAKTPDKVLYEKIDLGIPANAAKLASKSGVKNVSVVSSMGANAESTIFYSALKGKMEAAFLAENFENLNLVRPSLLLGDRDEKRMGEGFGAFIMTTFSFLIPEKHKAIEGKTVAKAMVALANTAHQKSIWLNQEIKEVAAKS